MNESERNKTGRFPFDTVFAAVLFCMFTVAALLLAVTGGRIYKSIADDLDAGYLARTALSYVAGKNRYNGACECEIRDEAGTSVLCFSETIDGTEYETLIWFAGGELRERFAEAGAEFNPESGAGVLELEGFSAELEGSLLTVSVSAKGAQRSSALCVNPVSEDNS